MEYGNLPTVDKSGRFFRVLSPNYPNTISGVINQQGQFTPVSDGTINNVATQRAIKAAYKALYGIDTSKGALFFYNDILTSPTQWIRTRPIVNKIGEIVFAN